MTFLSKKYLLLPLLALGIALAPVAPAHAGPAVSLQISLGHTPHWDAVQGTNVRVIRQSDRGDYDMFRYGNYYYTFNNTNNRWYRSRHYRGQFRLIDERSVPTQFRRVPRDRWGNYPSAWDNRGAQGYDNSSVNTSGSFQVTFGSTPRWYGIEGTSVEEVYGTDRPSYDVFRYGGSYYAYNNNHWYSSPNQSGQFAMMDDRAVPAEFSKVPSSHWRNYPAAYGNKPGNPNPGNGNMGNGNMGNMKGHGNGNGRGNGKGGN